MKVRHKSFYGETAPIEVHEWGKDTPYYFPTDTLNHGVTLPREHYEPAPEEHWVDVTRECEVSTFTKPYCEIWHEGTRLVHLAPDSGYRFVKKHFLWQDAFIVEKKESR